MVRSIQTFEYRATTGRRSVFELIASRARVSEQHRHFLYSDLSRGRFSPLATGGSCRQQADNKDVYFAPGIPAKLDEEVAKLRILLHSVRRSLSPLRNKQIIQVSTLKALSRVLPRWPRSARAGFRPTRMTSPFWHSVRSSTSLHSSSSFWRCQGWKPLQECTPSALSCKVQSRPAGVHGGSRLQPWRPPCL